MCPSWALPRQSPPFLPFAYVTTGVCNIISFATLVCMIIYSQELAWSVILETYRQTLDRVRQEDRASARPWRSYRRLFKRCQFQRCTVKNGEKNSSRHLLCRTQPFIDEWLSTSQCHCHCVVQQPVLKHTKHYSFACMRYNIRSPARVSFPAFWGSKTKQYWCGNLELLNRAHVGRLTARLWHSNNNCRGVIEWQRASQSWLRHYTIPFNFSCTNDFPQYSSWPVFYPHSII